MHGRQGWIQKIQKEGAEEIVARVPPTPNEKFTFVEMLLTAF